MSLCVHVEGAGFSHIRLSKAKRQLKRHQAHDSGSIRSTSVLVQKGSQRLFSLKNDCLKDQLILLP